MVARKEHDVESAESTILRLLKSDSNAWSVIAKAQKQGMGEDSARRAIWQLIDEKKIYLTHDRKLVRKTIIRKKQ